jgi:SpoVK/Ycf46/Vps4 family AAA+-type ATPase
MRLLVKEQIFVMPMIKYANQEVAYLLQRIESHSGLVILATNQRSNVDDAFSRRFHAIIHFLLPRPEEPYEIWLKAVPQQLGTNDDIDWQQVAVRFELTGAGIMNVIHFGAVEALADGISICCHKTTGSSYSARVRQERKSSIALAQ